MAREHRDGARAGEGVRQPLLRRVDADGDVALARRRPLHLGEHRELLPPQRRHKVVHRALRRDLRPQRVLRHGGLRRGDVEAALRNNFVELRGRAVLERHYLPRRPGGRGRRSTATSRSTARGSTRSTLLVGRADVSGPAHGGENLCANRHVRQRRRRDGADPRLPTGHEVGARPAHAAGGAAPPTRRAPLSQMQALQPSLRQAALHRACSRAREGARSRRRSRNCAPAWRGAVARVGAAQRQRQQEPRVSELQATVERLTAEELQALGAQQRRVDGWRKQRSRRSSCRRRNCARCARSRPSRSSRHGDAQALEAAHAAEPSAATPSSRASSSRRRSSCAPRTTAPRRRPPRGGASAAAVGQCRLWRSSRPPRSTRSLCTTPTTREALLRAAACPPAARPRVPPPAAHGGGFGGGLSHSASFAATPFSTRPATPTGSRAGGLTRPASAATPRRRRRRRRVAPRADRADRVVRGAARGGARGACGRALAGARVAAAVRARHDGRPSRNCSSASTAVEAREGARLERQREKLGQRIGEPALGPSHGAPYEQVMHGSEPSD